MNGENERLTFDTAADAVAAAFVRNAGHSRTEVTPGLLTDAIRQFFDLCAKLDRDHGRGGRLPYDDVNEISANAINCVSDLALWAVRLGLDGEHHAIENAALDFAQWAIRHDGKLTTLEPVVNALAWRANTTHHPDDLTVLFYVARELVAHAAPQTRNSFEATDAAHPWRVLNFNLAIIATRTQNQELMDAAFDLLEQNLPDACAGFYEEGLRQAEKKVYEPHVRELMRRRFAKWTTKH
jgi:hypothetical protein